MAYFLPDGVPVFYETRPVDVNYHPREFPPMWIPIKVEKKTMTDGEEEDFVVSRWETFKDIMGPIDPK